MLVDLATMLIDGGECVSDLGALADQPDLLGQIASHSTRVADPARNRCPERAAIRLTRAAARERAWALGADLRADGLRPFS